MAAAKDLAMELELSQQEREALAATIDDLVADNPRTQVAATRFERLIKKAGEGAKQMFWEVLKDVLSQGAKRILFPDSWS